MDERISTRTVVIGAALVVAALGTAGAFLVIGDDDSPRPPQEVGSRTTSSAAPTSTTTRPAFPSDTSGAVWPSPAAGIRYVEPVAAARGFAVDFVGFVDPVIGAYQAHDERSGSVPVRRNANGPVTTVGVGRFGAEGTWWVTGSSTPNIQLASPVALGVISSPAPIRGTSTAFEALVNVELREDDSPRPLVSSFVMGGANGVMGPFEGTLTFAMPRAPTGALVLLTRSAEDGRVAEATVVRVRFRSTPQ